jgi:pimeloyl-ACP methyl ester carboxylesterase
MGYVEVLKNDYEVILIDARGHGASDKPHDPEAYKMALRVGDVVAVLDDLNVSKAHFLGYSMGGWIGFGIAKYATERFHSLIIGGTHPYEVASEEPSFVLELLKKGMNAVLTMADLVFGERWTPELKAIVETNDLEALIALGSVKERLGFEDILPELIVPCLLFVGEAAGEYRGAKECAKALPNATFVSLPGLDHIEGVCRVDLVLPHIAKFLAKVNQI